MFDFENYIVLKYNEYILRNNLMHNYLCYNLVTVLFVILFDYH